jgi:hypothetical protein
MFDTFVGTDVAEEQDAPQARIAPLGLDRIRFALDAARQQRHRRNARHRSRRSRANDARHVLRMTNDFVRARHDATQCER